MFPILKGLHSGFCAVCIAVYTVIGAALLFILFPFLRRGRYIDALTRVWCRLVLRTCRITVSVEGLENLNKDGRYIFTANHQSLFDIPVCCAVIPGRLRMLAKKELFRIPVFGWSIWAIGHVRIDREDRDSAIASVDRAAERLKKEDITPMVFPEGTRSPDGKIHPFKKGAFVLAIKSGRSVVPVTIIGSRSALPKKSLIVHPGHIHVIIDKPVPTTGYDFDDRDTLVGKVHKIIEKQFYVTER